MIGLTPQEVAAVVDVRLGAIQKAITLKQLPVRKIGGRRFVDELDALALALPKHLPPPLTLTVPDAVALLRSRNFSQAADVEGFVMIGGTVRVDLKEALAVPLERLRLLMIARDAMSDAGRPAHRIPALVRQIKSGETQASLSEAAPDIDRDDLRAAALWVEANPVRGRPSISLAVETAAEPSPQDLSSWTRTMRISAGQIAKWAASKDAQTALPWVVRRLAHTAGSITAIDFPAGDETSSQGWDGTLLSENGNAWVPRGRSFWELSCDASPATKANSDYKKRTDETSPEVRKASTLIIVTGRKWSQKKKWVHEKTLTGNWADIKAYDANDLEQWLEQHPPIALLLADLLGLTGPGVESPVRYWEGWSLQSDPKILKSAFVLAREEARDRLLQTVLERLSGPAAAAPVKIRADSIEEAVAFVCAVLSGQAQFAASSLVVTEADGWRYVEQNPAVSIAVVARPEIAERPSRRPGLVVIIPYAAGDVADHYRGAAAGDPAAEILLPRPRSDDFEKALAQIGVAPGDVQRLTATSGRSWSAFRRNRATNPALRMPRWLDLPQIGALSTVCLLGGWSSEKVADKLIVETVSGRPYEEVERDLRALARIDDAPILEIGHIWKAKAPLELLDVFGGRITEGELGRYFTVIGELLTENDPELELPDEQRYAAAIYGKTRPQSGLLIRALCDTLVKLAVRGAQMPGLTHLQLEDRASRFVSELLADAEPSRWLSLASLLPCLAEAAPNAFLQAILRSLSRADAPVTVLLTESGGSGISGRCWHAGLLWALETLAWAPERLGRVAAILARLAHVRIAGNWGNTPHQSLFALFRSWLPQTAANFEQRLQVLDQLSKTDPDVAFQIFDRLADGGPETALPSARPHWRDDDAGAGRGVSEEERWQMMNAAADRYVDLIGKDSGRIAGSFDKIGFFDDPRIDRIFEAARAFLATSPGDDEREVIRVALRGRIHHLRNYADEASPAIARLPELEELYEHSVPIDVVQRHQWLFETGWPDLPMEEEANSYEGRSSVLDRLRLEALKEILSNEDFEGVVRLAHQCSGDGFVGVTLTKLGLPRATLAAWIVNSAGDLTDQDRLRMAVLGVLRATEESTNPGFLADVVARARHERWACSKLARLLVLARDERTTWEIAKACGPEVENLYWEQCRPGLWLRADDPDFEFVLRRLMEAKRARTALQISHYDFKKIDAGLIADMLEQMLRGEEPDGPKLNAWDLKEAILALENAVGFPVERLVRLEFALFPALGLRGESCATSLYRAVMTEAKIFADLICLIFKPHNRERDEPIQENMKHNAETAWELLHHCRTQPGTQPGGSIDAKVFGAFIDEARKLCEDADRLAACDITIGGVLAHAPSDADGTWPCWLVRDALDRFDREDMRRGFFTGVFNKRGVTSRAYDAGGAQERELAKEYRGHARACRNSHPNLASTFDEIARAYERDAEREDLDARLRGEGR
jgi:hypothetical protein